MRLERVRVVVAPWFFRLPKLRRYHGYALWRTILLERPVRAGASDDLVTHELCHVWQMQNRPWRVIARYLTSRYRNNPYEREARWAVAETRPAIVPPMAVTSESEPSATDAAPRRSGTSSAS